MGPATLGAMATVGTSTIGQDLKCKANSEQSCMQPSIITRHTPCLYATACSSTAKQSVQQRWPFQLGKGAKQVTAASQRNLQRSSSRYQEFGGFPGGRLGFVALLCLFCSLLALCPVFILFGNCENARNNVRLIPCVILLRELGWTHPQEELQCTYS